ncbi:trypsin 3A1-like [Anopheles maculipalpis]|uniref:trypsin 3A1-like n=1 Tax=Anopheles maculipalpis TaxID=1496333 RepID=UPI002159A2CC|nr:trypsin 3A1-like [Anopheles maculipalpis]
MAPWLIAIVLTILLSEAALEIDGAAPRAVGRIVGGRDVEIDEYPYQLSLQNNGYHICGASVVATRLALTAGHCCIGTNVSNLTIRAGSKSHDGGGIVFMVNRIILHPEYDDTNLNYDVCVIRIVGSFLGKANISAIQVTNSGIMPAGGIVSGWGAVETNGNAVQNLRATKVKVWSTRECNGQIQNYVTPTSSMFCAGNVGSSICVGDSGGPLVYEQRQIGIVSFIINECGGTVPAVYTRLSNQNVRNFIKQQINNDQQRMSLLNG